MANIVTRKVSSHFCNKHLSRHIHSFLSDEVSQAIKKRAPILALESTIITHGLPKPHNYQMAQTVQKICHNENVTPATIGVIEGKIKIGLSNQDLHYISKGDKNFVKISRRDLAATVQRGLTGGTTVSATMLLAHQHNIDVFATGGIGGVHRGGQNTLDISADLSELGRTPVAVVCAGVKSILDISRTLEVLETQGVTIATFGRTREFPAFFTANSGYHSHTNVVDVKEAAELIFINKKLKLNSGIVIAVPIPVEYAANGLEIESAISIALQEAEEQKINGHEITPFLLGRVSKLTDGRSLKTNLALVNNNVLVGSRIASELSNLLKKDRLIIKNKTKETTKSILVVGAINVDIVCSMVGVVSAEKDLADGSINHVVGGVGRNVAECLTRCGINSSLISIVGDDTLGKMAVELCSDFRMATNRVEVIQGTTTPVAQILLKGGNVLGGVCDFSSHSYISRDLISDSDIQKASYVIIDCDIPLETAISVAQKCTDSNVPLIIEPTAPIKFQKFFRAGVLAMASIVTPNISEISNLFSEESLVTFILPFHIPECFKEVVISMLKCIEIMCCKTTYRAVLTTLGEKGVIYCHLSADGLLEVIYLSGAPEDVTIISSSGAGDSFLGGFFAALDKGHRIEKCLKIGTVCAWESLQVVETVSPAIEMQHISNVLDRWEHLEWDSQVLFRGHFEFSDLDTVKV